MTNVPNLGQKVRVWPMPGRRVQFDERPIGFMGGGRELKKSGETVEWTTFRMEQLKSGDLLMHHPPCEEHDHGDRGDDECMHCGRAVNEAETYDVHRAKGIEAAKAAADDGLPLHPYEQQELEHQERLKLRKARQDAKAKALEAKQAAPSVPAVAAPEPAPIAPPAEPAPSAPAADPTPPEPAHSSDPSKQ